MGCEGARVEQAQNLAGALREALASPRPFVLDVAVSS
jgi:thiamine pyrophosphate-dependent acetolactate synthase large subunit-like protein